MQDDSSVILFASNRSTSAPETSKFKQFSNEMLDRIVEADINLFYLVAAYTNPEIIDMLNAYGANIVIFHFDGEPEDYQSLRNAYQYSSVRSLSAYLGRLKQLRCVFLNGCATEEYINELLDDGVPVVVTSSYRLSKSEIELFKEVFYEELLSGVSIEEATEAAKNALGRATGSSQRLFVNIKGDLRTRQWHLLTPKIVSNSQTTTPQHRKDEKNKLEFSEKIAIPEWIFTGNESAQNPLVKIDYSKPKFQIVPPNRIILRLIAGDSGQRSQLLEQRLLVRNTTYLLTLEIILSDYEQLHMQQTDSIIQEKLVAITVFSHGSQITPNRYQARAVKGADKDVKFDFELKPMSLGTQDICVDIYQNRNWVSAMELNVTII